MLIPVLVLVSVTWEAESKEEEVQNLSKMKHIGTSVLDIRSRMEQAIAHEVIVSEGRVHHSIALAQAILLKANMFCNLICQTTSFLHNLDCWTRSIRL